MFLGKLLQLLIFGKSLYETVVDKLHVGIQILLAGHVLVACLVETHFLDVGKLHGQAHQVVIQFVGLVKTGFQVLERVVQGALGTCKHIGVQVLYDLGAD